MKLLLTAFCAALITSPLAFAEGKCDKGKCDKEKEESTLVAEGGKCDKGKCDKEKEKEESTLVAASTAGDQLAHCGKCGKGEKCKDCKDGEKCEKCKKHEEETKKEGTLMAESKCKKGKCDKEEEEESTLLA